MIVPNNDTLIVNAEGLSAGSTGEVDCGKVASRVKEAKNGPVCVLGSSNDVAKIVDACQRSYSRARIVNSCKSITGFEKPLRRRVIIRSLVLADNLPGIIDSVRVRATTARVNKGGVHASGQQEGDAGAVHAVKTHDLAGAIDSTRGSASDSRRRILDRGEDAATEQEPVRAFKRMVGVSEIVATDDLFRIVNIGSLGTKSRIGIIDHSEHAIEIEEAVSASVWEQVAAHDVAKAIDPASQRGRRARDIDRGEGIIRGRIWFLRGQGRGCATKRNETGDQ